MNNFRLMFHPMELKERIRWNLTKKKLHKCGKGVRAGRDFIVKGPEFITIGDGTEIQKRCQLMTYKQYQNKDTGYEPQLIIGNHVTITNDCFISCMNHVEIGDGCLLGVNTFITDNSHGENKRSEGKTPPNERKLYSKGPVVIGEHVWTGRNVCIMPGVHIGDGAVIGANAVVVKDIPAYTVAAGVPARVIRKLEEEKNQS